MEKYNGQCIRCGKYFEDYCLIELDNAIVQDEDYCGFVCYDCLDIVVDHNEEIGYLRDNNLFLNEYAVYLKNKLENIGSKNE